MEEAFHSTNTLYCSLRSFGFGAHSLLNRADDGGEHGWASKERHRPPNAVRGTEPYVPTPSLPTTTLPYSPPSPPVPQQFHPPSGSPLKEGKKPSHVGHRQRILDALATLLDTDGTRIAVAASGPYLRQEPSLDGDVVDGLVVDLIVCGAGPETRVPSQPEGAEVNIDDTAVGDPLQVLIDRGWRVPLIERAQALNGFFAAASTSEHSSTTKFKQTFKQLGRYIAASHADRVVQKIKNNSLSRILWETFCTLPISPTHRARQPETSTRPHRVPVPPTHRPLSLNLPPPSTHPPARPQTTRAMRDQADRDQLFLSRLLSSACEELLKGKVHIPKLKAVATSLSGNKSKATAPKAKEDKYSPKGSRAVEIYTDDTKVEFHQLLAWLLGSTEEGYLGALATFLQLSLEDPHTRGGPQPDFGDKEAEKRRNKRTKKVRKALNKLAMLGVLLRDTVASSAFSAHLAAVAPLLIAHRRRIEGSTWPRSDSSPSQGSGSVNGTFGTGVPQFDLAELGRNEENMDFNHAVGLAHAKDLDEHEAVEEVYGRWIKSLVGHLEAMVVLQRWVMNGGRGCRAQIRTVVGVPRRRVYATRALVPVVEKDDGKRAKSNSDDEGSRERAWKRPKLDHTQHSDAHMTEEPSGVIFGPPDTWREVLTDAFSEVQEYTEVAPDLATVIELVEELIHRDTLPEGLYVPLTAPNPQSTQWCPEACLATFIHGHWGHTPSTDLPFTKRKGANRDRCAAELQPRNATSVEPNRKDPGCGLFVEYAGTGLYPIGVSRGCCPSCNALLTALTSEPSPSKGINTSSGGDVGAVAPPEHPSTLVSEDPPKQKSLDATEEMKTESLWTGSHCCLPRWVSDDLAARAVLEARRGLVRLVNEELAEQFYDLEESDDDDSEVDGLDSLED